MVHCCIIGCKSRSERKAENITFHSFPKKSAVRQLWIRATGRPNWEPTKYTRICSRHFEQNCFRKTQNKTYLNESSLPTLHIVELSHVISSDITTLDQEVKIPSSAISVSEMDTETLGIPLMEKPSTSAEAMDLEMSSIRLMEKLSTSAEAMDLEMSSIPPMEKPSTSTEVMDLETSSDQKITPIDKAKSTMAEMTPRKQKLVKQLSRQKLLAQSRHKKLAAIRSKCWRLEKKNAELSAVIEKLQTKRYINQEAADLLSAISPHNSQYLKSNSSKYSPEVRRFALNLHFISPNAYNFVRKTFDTCLPHTRTLARWYQTVKGDPGFSTESLTALKLLAENSSRKWVCGLSFDEMAIRKSVEWNGKNYVGFVNCGDQLESDFLPVAKEVLVFMLTCLNGSWKLPVGYFLTNGVSAEQKASLVKICIDLVSECGLDVAAVTFDGCPANLSMAKLLGCQLEGDVINPVFSHKGKKVVIFPDPSHMLKLVRNTLGDKLLLTNAEGKTVSWEYIKILVELQEREGFHLANKVRGAHIKYKKQIMKVKLASQLFSESVADALDFCSKDLGLEQFQHCEATVDFIRKFNTLFDIMNSRNLNAIGYKKPLKPANFENVKAFLENMFVYIKSLKMGTANILNSNRKTGFLGFMISIKSALFLYKELVETSKLDFLATYKLSQDHLEIFFSAIRAKGGFNNNPTATQFQSAYKRMLVHGEMKHLTTGNCIPLTEINILTCTCTKPEIAINNTTSHSRVVEDDRDLQQTLDSEVVISNDHDYLADPTRLTEFARHVIIYIAGFVVKALETQIKCEQCLTSLVSTEKMENTLQYRKDKGGLHYPSKAVIKLCEIAEEVYKKNRMLNKKDTMHYLLQECLKKCIGLKLFSKDHECSDRSGVDSHYSLLIKAICKKFLNVRIHYATKTMTTQDENVRNMYTKLILFKGQ